MQVQDHVQWTSSLQAVCSYLWQKAHRKTMWVLIASLLVGSGVSFGVWLWLMQTSRKNRLLAKIPGPKPLPLLGNALELKTDGAGFYVQLFNFWKHYGNKPAFKLMFGTEAFVYLYHPETAEVIYTTTKHITKPPVYGCLHLWLGTGLLTSAGHKWWVRRKLLTPTFHFLILSDFLPVINKEADILVEKLKKKVDKDSFDIFPYITLCALDIICETAMGRTVNAQEDSSSEYVEAIHTISNLIFGRMVAPWLWSDFVYNITPAGRRHAKCLSVLHGFTRKVISKRIAELEKTPLNIDVNKDAGKKKIRMAFLDLLLSQAKDANLSFYDIQEEVDTFMFEGHDTTTAAASWAIYCIGKHPEVQRRLHEEMDAIFGDSNRPVTMEDLKEMKYLERVVKETLRLFPSVPLMGRVLEEDTLIGGYEVPKGSTTIVPTFLLHRDPKHFPEPEKFDPDRFTQENSVKRHPFAYIPFSAGQRNCIGQRFAMNEEKVVLSAILRNFNIESTQAEEDLVPCAELILRPSFGIRVKLTARM